jgi:hypothetical protein
LGVRITAIPLQGASSSSTPTAREGLGHLVSGVSGLKKASKAGNGGIKPGNVGTPKQAETSTETLNNRPRSMGSTPTETARPPKRPRDLQGGSDQHKDSYLQGNIT